MDQKGHTIDQKALKMYEKVQKLQFWDLKYLLFIGIFLSGIGGYPSPPLKGKSSCPKTLSGKGGYKLRNFTLFPCLLASVIVSPLTFDSFSSVRPMVKFAKF